tara:strand:+ start:1121 stop:1429 length:309 start_codon:yes stop_codon:yes gene_type:complete
MRKLFLIAFLFIFVACEDEEKPLCNIKATLEDYSDLDGCGFVIMLEDSTILEIGDYDEEPDFSFRDGMAVNISYEEMKDIATACMVGPIVRITCIEKNGSEG